MKKHWRKIVNIIAIIVLVFCVCKIGYKEYEYHKADVANAKIQSVMNLKSPKTEMNPDTKEFSDLNFIKSLEAKEAELLKINPDYKFWIRISGTTVNYPVVQTNNNSYYLHHDFQNQPSIEGNLFLFDKAIIGKSRNLLVLGHNMRNGTMFGDLWGFKDTNFFDSHKYIEVIRGNKAYIYEIFGDAVVHADTPYLKSNFANQQEFMDYINLIKSKAYFWRDVDINDKTQLLTLSTCSYEFDNARFVIISKLVKVI